ncbi:UNVERIFIED_CONTAM: hypothetical protein PYX00_011232 [Menopon gallinae]|uniref:NADH:ubiquinone reductase (H(+)-translocating) n=1 Tax=Menopon gallinae TaxID=328185 RepID=A0AAW2H7A7_9NEOP
MEAPTPVSALVHSSTLVTAGIYLLVRYSRYWENNDVIREILITLSFSTLVMARFVAIGENDVKKVVALSTLRQLGLIMFALGNGMLEVGFFHLITHAYYKALIFIVVGYLLHNAGGNQDLKGVFLSSNTPMLYILLCCSSIALTGMPFLSGFYSKDLLVDIIVKISYYKVLGVIFTFILTLIYTTRVVFNLINNYRKFFSSSIKKSSR